MRAPQVQCWDRAVVNVDAVSKVPPAAVHSPASGLSILPGVNAVTPRPYRRAQVRTSTSSVIRWGPWAAMIACAVWRAKASLRRVVADAAAA